MSNSNKNIKKKNKKKNMKPLICIWWVARKNEILNLSNSDEKCVPISLKCNPVRLKLGRFYYVLSALSYRRDE